MEPRTIVEGLTFPEGPRWHDGRRRSSGFFTHWVLATDLDGNGEEMAPKQSGRLPATEVDVGGAGWPGDENIGRTCHRKVRT